MADEDYNILNETTTMSGPENATEDVCAGRDSLCRLEILFDPDVDYPIRTSAIVECVLQCLTCLCNLVLLTVLLIERAKLATRFFHLARLLTFSISCRYIFDIVFKLVPTLLASPYGIGENILTMYTNSYFADLSMLVVLFISINIYAVIVNEKLDRLLFKGNRFWYTVSGLILSAAATTGLTLHFSGLIRRYIHGYGYADTATDLELYNKVYNIWNGLSFVTLLPYLTVFEIMRIHSKTNMASGASTSTAERNLAIQGILFAAANLAVVITFEVVTYFPRGQVVLGAYVNTIVYVPDCVIPISLLMFNKRIKRTLLCRSNNETPITTVNSRVTGASAK